MGLGVDDSTELDVDREMAQLLEGPLPNAEGDDPEALVRQRALAAFLDVDTERGLLGAGRRLLRLQRQNRDLEASETALREEYAKARARLGTQMGMLEAAIGSVALARRAEGRGNALHLPGVGTWATRAVPGRWSVEDPEAVTKALTGSERESYLKPQPDKLDARALLADIDEVMARRGGEVLPGLRKGEDRIGVNVSYEGLR